MVLVIITTSPLVSKPVLPALPLICLYLAQSIYLVAINGVLNITTLAGRLIPVLNVDVATRTSSMPYLYPLSIIDFSSFVNPEWWYAIPYKIVYCKISQGLPGQFFSSSINFYLDKCKF